MDKNKSNKLEKPQPLACQSAAICYVIDRANQWLQDNATMYRGDNASDCMVAAYTAGMLEIVSGIKYDLLPACTSALESVSNCLTVDGHRCAPNMGDFVGITNALTIIDNFYQRFNSDT